MSDPGHASENKGAEHPRFRCPYCHEVFEGAHVKCPRCRRAMSVPGRFLQASFRVRRRTKEKIRRDAERARARLFHAKFDFGHKPTHILGILLVLLVVGGMLVGRAGSKFRRGPVDKEGATAGREVTTLRAGLEVFKIECGRYPTGEEGLYALVHNPGLAAWDGPYVSMIHPDPWQSQYQYAISNNKVRVFSCGRDKTAGTADDVLPSASGVKALLGKKP